MSLPNGHPAVPSSHSRDDRTCPALRKGHEWRSPSPSDSRSPCPALNTLANHGYLPRDGQNINIFNLILSLMQGYNLSLFLAMFLTFGGYYLLRKWPWESVSLMEIGEHGKIEHNASLVHEDTGRGEKYAPIKIHHKLVDLLIEDSKTGEEEGEGEEYGDRQILVDAEDVARARIRREKQSDELDPVHAEIARGEMAIILGVWETKRGESNVGVPADWMREWIGDEKFPDKFRFTHVQGFFDVVKRSSVIRGAMEKMRERTNAMAEGLAEKGDV